MYSRFHLQHSNQCIECAFVSVDELWFVQWYEVADENLLKNDATDKEVDFVRLKRHGTETTEYYSEQTASLDLHLSRAYVVWFM